MCVSSEFPRDSDAVVLPTRDHTLRITAIDIHVGKCAHPLIEREICPSTSQGDIYYLELAPSPTHDHLYFFFFSSWRSSPFPSWSSVRTHISVSLAKN